MDENISLENFDEVWARVADHSEDVPAPVYTESAPAEKICLIKRTEKSRASRFIPEI